jgi:hypothetical protein
MVIRKKVPEIESGCEKYDKWLAENRGHQGDQIGPIFAHWAIVIFVHFFENDRRSTNFWATFIPPNKLCTHSFLTKYGLGDTLGDFFTNFI